VVAAAPRVTRSVAPPSLTHLYLPRPRRFCAVLVTIRSTPLSLGLRRGVSAGSQAASQPAARPPQTRAPLRRRRAGPLGSPPPCAPLRSAPPPPANPLVGSHSGRGVALRRRAVARAVKRFNPYVPTPVHQALGLGGSRLGRGGVEPRLGQRMQPLPPSPPTISPHVAL
jgi:hypothetical protein